jgi:mono/diheme cytochrome c family protein
MKADDSQRSGLLPRVLAALSLAAAFAAPPAGAQDAQPKPPPLVESGQRLYVRHCAVCHGLSGTGDGPFAGILTVAPSDLTGITARRGSFPDDEIATFVDGRFVPKAHGTREMPIWGRWLGQPMTPDAEPDEVTRGEILAIVTYLKSLQR